MWWLVSALIVALTPMAFAQAPSQPTPPECVWSEQELGPHTDRWRRCAGATPPGSALHSLALINLGTEAFLRRDYAEAVRLYDAARPPAGTRMTSDVMFHSYRSAAYARVGRLEDAVVDAQLASVMLEAPMSARRDAVVPQGADVELAYALILPILHSANDRAFAGALERYKALPASDWVSIARRAAVMEEIGDFASAISLNEQALSMQPGHPMLANNHCYILTRAGRAAEGLPFCEKAVAGAPDEASVRHSYAAALAAAGKCERSRHELGVAQRLDPVSAEYRKELTCTAQ